MYGYDLNRDGVISSDEQAAGGAATTLNGVSNGSRGIANDLTVYTVQPNSRTPVSNTARLQAVLTKSISASRSNAIIGNLTTGTRGRPQTFSSLSQFYTAAGMTQSDLKAVAGQITASNAPAGSTVTGLINANTASREVLGGIAQQ